MSEPYLCVGGPCAGQFREVTGPRFTATVAKKVPVRLGKKKIAVVGMETVVYRLEMMSTPEGTISLWLPEGVSIFQAMQDLCDIYALAVQSGIWVSAKSGK